MRGLASGISIQPGRRRSRSFSCRPYDAGRGLRTLEACGPPPPSFPDRATTPRGRLADRGRSCEGLPLTVHSAAGEALPRPHLGCSNEGGRSGVAGARLGGGVRGAAERARGPSAAPSSPTVVSEASTGGGDGGAQADDLLGFPSGGASGRQGRGAGGPRACGGGAFNGKGLRRSFGLRERGRVPSVDTSSSSSSPSSAPSQPPSPPPRGSRCRRGGRRSPVIAVGRRAALFRPPRARTPTRPRAHRPEPLTPPARRPEPTLLARAAPGTAPLARTAPRGSQGRALHPPTARAAPRSLAALRGPSVRRHKESLFRATLGWVSSRRLICGPLGTRIRGEFRVCLLVSRKNSQFPQ